MLPPFTIDGVVIEQVSSFKYLGVIFKKNGSFVINKRERLRKAKSQAGILIAAVRTGRLTLSAASLMWRCVICPSLLWASGAWGDCRWIEVEALQWTTAKRLLGLPLSAPNLPSLALLGWLPLELVREIRRLHLWGKLVFAKPDSLVAQTYEILREAHFTAKGSSWLSSVEILLSALNLNDIWKAGHVPMSSLENWKQWISSLIKQTFRNSWSEYLNERMSVSERFRILKLVLPYPYPLRLSPWPRRDICMWSRLVLGHSELGVDTMRILGIPRVDRTCSFCNEGIEDAHHLLTSCMALWELRLRVLQRRIKPRKLKASFATGGDELKLKILLGWGVSPPFSPNAYVLWRQSLSFLRIVLARKKNRQLEGENEI